MYLLEVTISNGVFFASAVIPILGFFGLCIGMYTKSQVRITKVEFDLASLQKELLELRKTLQVEMSSMENHNIAIQNKLDAMTRDINTINVNVAKIPVRA